MKPQDALADNNPWDFCGFDGAGILKKTFSGNKKMLGNQQKSRRQNGPPAELPNPKLGGVFFWK